VEREVFATIDPAAMRSDLDVGGGRMAWREWGEGPPVVLVHGAAGSWNHWAAVIPGLAGDHLVVAPDLPGFGDSDAPADLDDIEVLVDALTALVDLIRSRHGSVTLVGVLVRRHRVDAHSGSDLRRPARLDGRRRDRDGGAGGGSLGASAVG